MMKILFTVLTNKSILVPTHRLNNVADIINNQELINKQKYIFDKDDTLVPLHQYSVTNPNINKLLSSLIQKDKQVYVVSNSVRSQGKTVEFEGPLGTLSLKILHTKNKKPNNAQEIDEYLNNKTDKTDPKDVVIVGDRLLTDIVMGNMQGWTTVLVEPIQQSTVNKHGIGVVIMRQIQKLILKLL